MDRFESMQVFTTVVELGSFTAAANAFKLSPAMVSKHISSLEQRLGVSLLSRTTRRLHVTEIGKNYYEYCKQIIKQLEEAEAGTEIMRGSPKGNLKVSASIWFGAITLAPIVCDYLTSHPEVNIDLTLSDRFVDIIDEGFDLAIRIGDLEDSSYIAKKLSMFELSICASPAYLAKNGTPYQPEDLQTHQCLGFTNWRSHSGWKLLQKQSIGKHPLPSRFDSNNGQALLAAALKGIGIIMMPKVLMTEHLEKGTLVEVLKEFTPAPRPVNAVYPKEKQATKKLTSFVDFLAAALRPD